MATNMASIDPHSKVNYYDDRWYYYIFGLTWLDLIKVVKGKLAAYEIDVFISIWYNHPSTMPSQYIRGQHLNRWCIKIIAL